MRYSVIVIQGMIAYWHQVMSTITIKENLTKERLIWMIGKYINIVLYDDWIFAYLLL